MRGRRAAGSAGPWRLGLEQGRQAVVPLSRRCMDYPHVVGSCRRSKLTPSATDGQTAEQKQRLMVFRQGAFRNLQALTKNPDVMKVLQDCFHVSRAAPPVLFSVLWHALLAWLQREGEDAAAELLRKHYLQVDEDGVLSAQWTCSVMDVQPGSGSGSQAQESWHNARFRGAFPSLRVELSNFLGDGHVRFRVGFKL